MVILHLKTRPINQLPARLKIVIQAELSWYHRALISSDMERETEAVSQTLWLLCMIEADVICHCQVSLNRVVLTNLFDM